MHILCADHDRERSRMSRKNKKSKPRIVLKNAVRCDKCGCAFVPETLTQREGEIEYSYFNCDYCCKAYIMSVTDAALRRSIRKYRSLAEKLKGKPLSEETLRDVTALKDANTKRAAELRQMYIREE